MVAGWEFWRAVHWVALKVSQRVVLKANALVENSVDWLAGH